MASHVTNQHAAGVLTSWKEIASYLGKGVRTVQRWEVEFGLPVRRPNKERHIVHAVPGELDAWLVTWSQRMPRPEAARPGSPDGMSSIMGHVRRSRDLTNTRRQLLGELKKSITTLTEQCRTLSTNMAGGGTTTLTPNRGENPVSGPRTNSGCEGQ